MSKTRKIGKRLNLGLRPYAYPECQGIFRLNFIKNPRDLKKAEIPGRVMAKAEALTGPMTPPGKLVQTLNPPGSEVGPGTVATWGKASADEVDAMGFKWNRAGRSSKRIPFDWSGP